MCPCDSSAVVGRHSPRDCRLGRGREWPHLACGGLGNLWRALPVFFAALIAAQSAAVAGMTAAVTWAWLVVVGTTGLAAGVMEAGSGVEGTWGKSTRTRCRGSLSSCTTAVTR